MAPGQLAAVIPILERLTILKLSSVLGHGKPDTRGEGKNFYLQFALPEICMDFCMQESMHSLLQVIIKLKTETEDYTILTELYITGVEPLRHTTMM